MTRICYNERLRQIIGSIDSESDYLSSQNVSKHNRLGRITTFLTWVTRHSDKARSHRDVDGWVPFDQIKRRSQARQLGITDMDIFSVVVHQKVARFVIQELRGDLPEHLQSRCLRNTQGHSGGGIIPETLFKRVETPPRELIHGCMREDWESIIEFGLIPGGGKHSRHALSLIHI